MDQKDARMQRADAAIAARPYLLHVTYASGRSRTLTFPDVFSRSLVIVTMAAQPVELRLEDPVVVQ
jgi:hypothetical protein